MNLRAKRCAEAARPRRGSPRRRTRRRARAPTRCSARRRRSGRVPGARLRGPGRRACSTRRPRLVGQRWPNVESPSSIAPGRPSGCSRRCAREHVPRIDSTGEEHRRPFRTRAPPRLPKPSRRLDGHHPAPALSNQSFRIAIDATVPSASMGQTDPSIATRLSPPPTPPRRASPRRIAGSAQAARNARARPPCRRRRDAGLEAENEGSRAESSQVIRAEARTTDDPRSRERSEIFTAAEA